MKQPLRRRLADSVGEFLTALADAIAPPRCLGCLREGTWLCEACHRRVQPLASCCVRCDVPTVNFRSCHACRASNHLEGVVSAGSYTNPLWRRGVHWLKFKGVRPVAATLAALMLEQLHAIAPLSVLVKQAVLVPIPLHARRQQQRGFNQSEALAAALAEQTGLPLQANALKRVKATWAQARLPREMRAANTDRAFALHDPLLPDRPVIILIDDITTTGATLSEAAKTIHTGYPPIKIWGATVARG